MGGVIEKSPAGTAGVIVGRSFQTHHDIAAPLLKRSAPRKSLILHFMVKWARVPTRCAPSLVPLQCARNEESGFKLFPLEISREGFSTKKRRPDALLPKPLAQLIFLSGDDTTSLR